MSKLTQCNHCKLKQLRAEAERHGEKVTITIGFGGGKDVFVHPATVTKKELLKGREDSKYLRAWMWKITKECMC